MAPDLEPQPPPIISLSDEDLMSRVAADDERAFTELVGRFQGRVTNLISRVLNDRVTGRITLAEAAAAAHLSIPAFSRFFRRKTGRTLVAYLNELRTGLACRELIETDRSISDIAFDSGFNNLSNFNRRFRALKGLNPRDFRGQFQSREP